MGAVKKEARLNGIRPMTIERLLAFLGYDMNTPVLGRVEGIDTNAMRRLTAPRRPSDAPKATIDTTKPAPKADDEMKEEKPKAEPKKKAAEKNADDAPADDKEPPK